MVENKPEYQFAKKRTNNKELCKAIKLMQDESNKVKIQRIKQELGRRGYYK